MERANDSLVRSGGCIVVRTVALVRIFVTTRLLTVKKSRVMRVMLVSTCGLEKHTFNCNDLETAVQS